MKEPDFATTEFEARRPMSQLTVSELERIRQWRNIRCDHEEDADFNRRYAAILLKERGVL